MLFRETQSWIGGRSRPPTFHSRPESDAPVLRPNDEMPNRDNALKRFDYSFFSATSAR